MKVRSKNGFTPLHFAVYHCRPSEVVSLIEHGSDVHATTDDRQTPLYMAVCNVRTNLYSKSKRAVQTMLVLLDKGADVNACDDDNGHYCMTTPLHAAVIGAHHPDVCAVIMEAITTLILYGAHINIKNMYGNTALHEAILSGHTELMTHLLACGVDMSITNFHGQTATQLAAHRIFSQGIYILSRAASDPARLKRRD